jgi:hypothetical protein
LESNSKRFDCGELETRGFLEPLRLRFIDTCGGDSGLFVVVTASAVVMNAVAVTGACVLTEIEAATFGPVQSLELDAEAVCGPAMFEVALEFET